MVSLTYGTPEEAGMDPERIARLRERAPEWIDGHRMRSGVLLAARRGKIFYHEAFGPLTDQPGAPPMQKDSVFSISSITKPITATAIMLLVEDGLLGLNRPIKEYFPEICGEGTDDIEVQHLLTHTSGYDDAACWKTFGRNISRNRHLGGDPSNGLHRYMDRYLSCLWDQKVGARPGSLMSYCNHNYALLVEIVRRVAGQAPEEFTSKRIFEPLRMTDTTCFRDDAKNERQMLRGVGVPYGSDPKNPYSGHEDPWFRSVFWGFMGVNSNALDLAKFGQMFLDHGICDGKRILSSASVHEMNRNQVPGIPAILPGETTPVDATWSLGWMIQGPERWKWHSSSLLPEGAIYHSGAGGHRLWVDRDAELVGVLLNVCLDIDTESIDQKANADLFQNMVTAAVVD